MNDNEWTVGTLKQLVEAQIAQRDKHWQEIRAGYERRLTDLHAELDALEDRYEKRHEQIEIDVALLKARLFPVFWIGAALFVALIGTVVSHLTVGTP